MEDIDSFLEASTHVVLIASQGFSKEQTIYQAAKWRKTKGKCGKILRTKPQAAGQTKQNCRSKNENKAYKKLALTPGIESSQDLEIR